jgi:3-hydroxybutyryl-CoA dehydrogenase
MNLQREEPESVGVVGLGLMGKSIVACLLGSGHPVTAFDLERARRIRAKQHVLRMLEEMHSEGLLKRDAARAVRRFRVANSYSAVSACDIIIEAITEDLQTKRKAIQELERVVSPSALIASNTSAIRISNLQKKSVHPERILGMHWDEPAHVTRFMEIVCGELTSRASFQRAMALAGKWGKEPSLVRKDVRGFIANRISYAMFREAFHLVESGVASVADVDRSLRNDVGYWITFAGPFRYMDLMGIPGYGTVMKDLLPDLDCSTKVPKLMKKVVASGARGISNGRGFYRYTARQARR